MNETYYITFTGLFLAASPLLVAVRLVNPKRMPWWLLGTLAALLGWIFANLAVHFYYQHLDDLLTAAGGVNGAPQDLIDRWQNDGAKLAFAYLFGWLYGLIYLAPWLVVHVLAAAVRKMGAAKRNSTAAKI